MLTKLPDQVIVQVVDILAVGDRAHLACACVHSLRLVQPVLQRTQRSVHFLGLRWFAKTRDTVTSHNATLKREIVQNMTIQPGIFGGLLTAISCLLARDKLREHLTEDAVRIYMQIWNIARKSTFPILRAMTMTMEDDERRQLFDQLVQFVRNSMYRRDAIDMMSCLHVPCLDWCLDANPSCWVYSYIFAAHWTVFVSDLY